LLRLLRLHLLLLRRAVVGLEGWNGIVNRARTLQIAVARLLQLQQFDIAVSVSIRCVAAGLGGYALAASSAACAASRLILGLGVLRACGSAPANRSREKRSALP
jgi:hypothetical protein